LQFSFLILRHRDRSGSAAASGFDDCAEYSRRLSELRGGTNAYQ
jgi:hypothetical protein